jgi:hypothetical protein
MINLDTILILTGISSLLLHIQRRFFTPVLILFFKGSATIILLSFVVSFLPQAIEVIPTIVGLDWDMHTM